MANSSKEIIITSEDHKGPYTLYNQGEAFHKGFGPYQQDLEQAAWYYFKALARIATQYQNSDRHGPLSSNPHLLQIQSKKVHTAFHSIVTQLAGELSPRLLYALGDCYQFGYGDYEINIDLALDYYKKAVGKDSVAAMEALGDFHKQQNDTALAIKYYLEVLSNVPTNKEVHCKLCAMSLFNNNKLSLHIAYEYGHQQAILALSLVEPEDVKETYYLRYSYSNLLHRQKHRDKNPAYIAYCQRRYDVLCEMAAKGVLIPWQDPVTNKYSELEELLTIVNSVASAADFLTTAAKFNLFSLIRECRKKFKVSLDALDKDGNTALMVSLERQNNEMTKHLIKNGARLDIRRLTDGKTALHVAASADYLIFVYDPFLDRNISRPIGCYLFKHYLTTVDSLTSSYGALDLNTKDFFQNTVLHYAVEAGHVELVRALCEHGASLESKNQDEETPLMLAAKHKKTLVAFRTLLNDGADIYTRSPMNDTVLHLLMKPKRVADYSVRRTVALLKKGMAVNLQNAHGDTPLHLAIRSGLENAAKMLISHGANIHIKNRREESPFDYYLSTLVSFENPNAASSSSAASSSNAAAPVGSGKCYPAANVLKTLANENDAFLKVVTAKKACLVATGSVKRVAALAQLEMILCDEGYQPLGALVAIWERQADSDKATLTKLKKDFITQHVEAQGYMRYYPRASRGTANTVPTSPAISASASSSSTNSTTSIRFLGDSAKTDTLRVPDLSVSSEDDNDSTDTTLEKFVNKL